MFHSHDLQLASMQLKTEAENLFSKCSTSTPSPQIELWSTTNRWSFSQISECQAKQSSKTPN